MEVITDESSWWVDLPEEPDHRRPIEMHFRDRVVRYEFERRRNGWVQRDGRDPDDRYAVRWQSLCGLTILRQGRLRVLAVGA